MASKKKEKDKAVSEKLSRLKLQQDKWMEQRARSIKTTSNDAPRSNALANSAKKSHRTTVTGPSEYRPGKTVSKNDNVMMWSSKSSSISDISDGFVIRKSSTVSSKTSSKKSSHSSKQSSKSSSSSSEPSTARSENFVPSKTVLPKDQRDVICSDFNEAMSGSHNHSAIEDEKLIRPDKLTIPTAVSALQETGYDHRRYETFTQDLPHLRSIRASQKNERHKEVSNSESNSILSQHQCPSCRELMIGDRYAPYIVFPCGHTFCFKCVSENSYCPTCKCGITSSQGNDALQRVIQLYQQQLETEEMERKEQEVRKYVAEYHSLNTRAEVLKAEAEDIIDGMEEITSQLINSKDTLKQIDDMKLRLQQQIQDLQSTLQKQDRLHEGESERCKKLSQEYDSQKEKLTMIEKTLKTLYQSTDRIKMIVESFSPTINLDDYR